MAGAGYKLFNTGDVLTAAQVNTYLQEQVVMVFANSTARTTALSGVLAEGMVSYLKDTDALEIYSGSAWVGYGSGDITGITTGATSGLTGGVTSGTADLKLNTTAKGGLLVGTGSGTASELAVGTNAQVLTADSTTATGLKWATAASGGTANWSLLNTGGTALTGAQTITVSGISGADKIMILINGASSASASSYITFRLNTDTGAKYTSAHVDFLAASTYATSFLSRGFDSADTAAYIAKMSGSATSTVVGGVMISGCNSSGVKAYHFSAGGNDAGSNGQMALIGYGYYDSTSTITSISLFSTTGNFDAGTVFVYTSA